MKLLKKLLPIASVASVAAIVAPIATSCNNGNIIDGKTRFIPTVAQAVADADHAETGYDDPDATQLYIKDVKANTEVFVQDVKVILSSLFYSDIWDATVMKYIIPEYKVELNYSNFVVDTTEGAETMSFELKGSIYAKNCFDIDLPDMELSNIEIKVDKMPYAMNFSWSSYNWVLMSEYVDNGLSITSDASIITKVNGMTFEDSRTPGTWYKFDNETITIDKEHSVEDLDDKWEAIYEMLIPVATCVLGGVDGLLCGSYHMANIAPVEEP